MIKEDRGNIPMFTKEMKKKYTVLIPSMLPIHFELIKHVLEKEGYKVASCGENREEIIEEGLMNTHNDMCYPAMLVVGQLINELKSGKHDLDQVALMMFQTGGGCRASNYIYMIRKALKKNNMEHIPVISVSLSGLEKHPGFKITVPLLSKVFQALLYGDLLMSLRNQCLPYEVNAGETDRCVEQWTIHLANQLSLISLRKTEQIYQKIVEDFGRIRRKDIQKTKVGIVGEIYMKYAPLGNNYLEEFLIEEGMEVVLSGVVDFFMYCVINPQMDYKLYNKNKKQAMLNRVIYKVLRKEHMKLCAVLRTDGKFYVPSDFETIQKYGEDNIHLGVKMGEGWLLTAEMVELIESGVPNIVCTQPFGCLPNHVSGKGMLRKLKEKYPESNIVAIDYDPSDSKINQQNRLKLMIAQAELLKSS